MISVEEAFQRLRENLPDFGDNYVSSAELYPELISSVLIADRDYPPIDRVMMDGIAVSFAAWKEGRKEFRVLGVCAAGEPAATLTDPAGCLEVMTGAPLPQGADLVIPYEHIEIKNAVASITHDVSRNPKENVHLYGSDVKASSVVLSAGHELNGPHWGIAASMGAVKVKVKKRPRIQIISTGDELVEIDATPASHELRRSNVYAIKASLQLHGYRDITLTHLRDDVSEIERHFDEASRTHDLLIYSGGISKGKFDHLPLIWEKAGVKKHFHGVSQRPGKPLYFGVHEETKTAILGLPGNPVSSLVCLHRYFLHDKRIFAALTGEITFKKDLTYFVPCRLEFSTDGRFLAHPMPVQNSGEFTGLAGSDGFIELPKDRSRFSPGEVYLFHPWRKM